MQIIKTTLITISALIIAACTAHKKSTASTVASTPSAEAKSETVVPTPTIASTAPSNNFMMVKPSNGSYPPGNQELTALQAKYPQLKDASLEKLNQGHIIYAKAACIKCHTAQNIYNYDELRWATIIGDMALRARLTDAEKDAVFNYVIAVKATQPK